MNFIELDNAYDLREFLNGIPAKDLRAIYLRTLADDVKGVRITVNTLSDGSESVDYVFV